MDNASLQLLLDRAEISDVQLRYATGVDMRDWKLFRSCFADEIDVDFSSVFAGGGGPRTVSGDQWTRQRAAPSAASTDNAAHDHQSRHHG